MTKKDGKWEIFTVKYRLPLFGVDGEYQKETHSMMINTRGGAEDAKKACLQYHKGCKIESVLDRLATIVDENSGGAITRSISEDKKKSTRKK